MTYCVGVMLDKGMVFASDSRTHAGVDNFAKFRIMSIDISPSATSTRRKGPRDGTVTRLTLCTASRMATAADGIDPVPAYRTDRPPAVNRVGAC